MTTVLDAITQVTQDARERLALAVGAVLEGGSIGSGPFPTGDSGTSYGPWQFHFVGPTKLGLTPEQAQDPTQAAAAILPAYSAAVKRVPDALWNSNPAQAAATAAYYAEQPATMYPASRIADAWSTVTGSGGGSGGNIIPVGVPDWLNPSNLPDWLNPTNIPGIGTAASVIATPFVAIADVFKKLADPSTWWRILFVIAGAALVFVGLGVLNAKSIEQGAVTAAKAAA